MAKGEIQTHRREFPKPADLIPRHPPVADRPCNPFLAFAGDRASLGAIPLPYGADTPESEHLLSSDSL